MPAWRLDISEVVDRKQQAIEDIIEIWWENQLSSHNCTVERSFSLAPTCDWQNVGDYISIGSNPVTLYPSRANLTTG
jgi:hypothetical protein